MADGTNGDIGGGEFRTFTGSGFGTLTVRAAPSENGTGGPPKVVSERGTLRRGLPAMYQENDFGMRFVGGLETLLDPIAAILDALPAHFDPALAPTDLLRLMAAWLGIELDESQPTEEKRVMVARAAELGRRRGTVRGLALALELSFPGLPLRIEDSGGILREDGAPPPKRAPVSFVVYCDRPVAEERLAAIAHCIERYKPVHTTYRLRVKAGKS